MEFSRFIPLFLGSLILCDSASMRTKRQTTYRVWPDGLIPYNIPNDTYTAAERVKIRIAMDRWEQKTCVKFEPWSDELRNQLGEVRYINFYKGGSCFSRHGFHQHQPQVIGIGTKCTALKTIIHELGHAIGMKHTMERIDRDNYIDIHYENLNLDSRRNYDTTEAKGQIYPLFGTPYDYKSIMHYGPKAYSGNGGVVMVTKDPAYEAIIGKANDVSFYDAMFVNRAYKCTENCLQGRIRYTCLNGGFTGGPDCNCICPDGFMGDLCEIPLPGYDKIVSWSCQTNWNFVNGRCYRLYSSTFLTYKSALRRCTGEGSEVATFRTKSDMDWILRVMKEQLKLTSAQRFWIGLHRNSNETVYRFEDGILYDTTLMPIHEMGSSSSEGCVTTDGVTLRGVGCADQASTGFICMKNFDPACGGRYRLTTRGTFIQSPGYPGKYPKSLNCQYVLQAPSGMQIELRFDNFHLESHSKCASDYLQVQTMNDILDEGKKYCASSLNNKTIQSEGNLVMLTMKTDSSIAKTGFRVFAKTVSLLPRPTQPPRPPSLLDTLNRLFASRSGDSTDSDGNTEFLKTLWNLFHSTSVSKVL